MTHPRAINELEAIILEYAPIGKLGYPGKKDHSVEKHLKRAHGITSRDGNIEDYNNLWEIHVAEKMRKHITENGLLSG